MADAIVSMGIDIKLPASPEDIARGVLMLRRSWDHAHPSLPFAPTVESTPKLLTVTYVSLLPREIELRKEFGIPLYG